MLEGILGLLVLLIMGFCFVFILRIVGTLDRKRIVAEMEADLRLLQAEIRNKCDSDDSHHGNFAH